MSGGGTILKWSCAQNFPVAANPKGPSVYYSIIFKSISRREFSTSLDFVNDHNNVVPFGNVSQALEKRGGRMMVSAFTLDRLNNQSGDRAMPILDANKFRFLMGLNDSGS